MPRWRLCYHLVLATRKREPRLGARAADVVERSIRATCHEHRAIVHAVGIMPDHVHAAVSIPPSVAISAVVGRLQGSASHLLNHANGGAHEQSFAWQAEHGIVSFGETNLPDVVADVENQEARHAQDRLWENLESAEDRPQPPSWGVVGSARGLRPRAAGAARERAPEHA